MTKTRNLPDLQRRLAGGLAGWLHFEFDCQRGYLFSEKYLALPVGQLLNATTPGTTRAEFPHPILATEGTVGRPPQLDFVVEDSAGIKMLAVETKWVGLSQCSPADILWDIVRLELAANEWKCPSLFILAGLNKSLRSLFSKSPFTEKTKKGKSRALLPLVGYGTRQVRIRGAHASVRSSLLKQMQKHESVKFPAEALTSHPAIFPKKPISLSFSVYVWAITPAAKRTTFVSAATATATA